MIQQSKICQARPKPQSLSVYLQTFIIYTITARISFLITYFSTRSTSSPICLFRLTAAVPGFRSLAFEPHRNFSHTRVSQATLAKLSRFVRILRDSKRGTNQALTPLFARGRRRDWPTAPRRITFPLTPPSRVYHLNLSESLHPLTPSFRLESPFPRSQNPLVETRF